MASFDTIINSLTSPDFIVTALSSVAAFATVVTLGMPVPEVSFFGIVLSIQQKTGGNLSEALGNLSGVLRGRKSMRGKIEALSGEAKASAMIIGSLPPGVMLMVYLSTPSYMSLLWTTHIGEFMIMGCVVWMSMGILIMRKMINFNF